MTIDDAVARLTAGLDEDEQIAQAAAKRAGEWRVFDGSVRGEPFYPADPENGIDAGGETCIVYDEGYPLRAEARHIARFDPKTELRRVEVLREVIAKQKLYSSATFPDFEGGYSTALDDVVDLLASIYTEGEL